MGWAAHDPEGYDKVLVNAVCFKVMELFPTTSGCFDGEDPFEDLQEGVEWIQSEHSIVWDALIHWASDKIGEAESDYLITKHGNGGSL